MQTSVRNLLSRTVSSRVAGVTVAFPAALGIVVQGLAASAAAGVNPQIEVTNLILIKVNSVNEQQDGQLHVKGLVLLVFDWNTSKIILEEGDPFTITLPEEMEFHSTPVAPMDYDGQHVGQCIFTEKIVTCTFDAVITPLVQAGNKDIYGAGNFQLDVVPCTTQEELLFTVSHDRTAKADLPGVGGILKPSGGTYRPNMCLYKSYNGIMKEGNTQVLWYFNFDGPRLMKALGVTFSGQISHIIIFNDTLGTGIICPPQRIYLHAIDSEENPSQSLLLDLETKEGPTAGDQGTFKVTNECGGMTADGAAPITLVVKGLFRAEINYSLSCRALLVGGTTLPGTGYTNTMTVIGIRIIEGKTTQFVKAGSVQVAIRQGEGIFSVTKRTAANYVQQTDAGMAFTVAFDYESPVGTTMGSYPKRTPPMSEDNSSTLNADKCIDTATVVVKRGEEISFATPFPVGMAISNLCEGTLTANLALPAGYTWKDPEFTIGAVAGASLMIEDQKTTKVNLLDTVGVADDGSQAIKKASDAESTAVKKLSLNYTCILPDNTKKNGQTVDVMDDETPMASPEKLPVDITYEVAEGTAGVGTDGYTFDPTDHDAQSVMIGMGSEPTVTVTLVDTYTRDMGRFSATKTVASDAGDKAPDTYTFDYTCKADGKDPITGIIIVGKDESKKSDEVPAGHSYTVKEHVDQGQDSIAYLESYTLDVVANLDVTIAKGTVLNIGVTNTYTLNKGTSPVRKVIQGAIFTGADSTFTVQYTCTHSSVTLTDERKASSLMLTSSGTAVMSPSLPFSTSCIIREADGSVQHAGYAVTTTYTAGQVTVGATVPSFEVMVTNTCTPLEGEFDISKAVDDDRVTLAKDKKSVFGYTCTPLTGAVQVKGTVVIKGEEIGVVTDVPVGSCSVSERDVTIGGTSLSTVLAIDGSTNGVNNGTAVFDTRGGTTVKVVVANTYVLDRGSFSVTKAVIDGADSPTHDTLVFDYVCTGGTEGCFDVLGDGTAVEGSRMSTGTECALTECVQTANHEGYTVVSELSDDGKVTITDRDTVMIVTTTNMYTPVPTPTPPGEALAGTNASSMLTLGVIGSVLTLAGGVLVAVRRRRDRV